MRFDEEKDGRRRSELLTPDFKKESKKTNENQ